jgi:hypothetical protein
VRRLDLLCATSSDLGSLGLAAAADTTAGIRRRVVASRGRTILVIIALVFFVLIFAVLEVTATATAVVIFLARRVPTALQLPTAVAIPPVQPQFGCPSVGIDLPANGRHGAGSSSPTRIPQRCDGFDVALAVVVETEVTDALQRDSEATHLSL